MLSQARHALRTYILITINHRNTEMYNLSLDGNDVKHINIREEP